MNVVIIDGRLTKDVEVRQTPNGTTVARFCVAVPVERKQEGKPDADFVNCVAFGKTGDFIAKYFSKGSGIVIDGQLRSNQYTDKEGRKRIDWTINVEKAGFPQGTRQESAPSPAPKEYKKPEAVQETMQDEFYETEDDLPF